MTSRTVLLYLCIFTGSVVLFVFLLFPARDIGQFVFASVEKEYPEVKLSCDQAKLKFPLKLGFENAVFNLNRSFAISPETLTLHLPLTAIFNQTKTVKVKSDLLQGNLEGLFKIQQIDPLSISSGKVNFSQIKVYQYRYKIPSADIVLTCRIGGNYDVSLSNKKSKSGLETGTGKINISDLSGTLKNPFFKSIGLSSFDFSTVDLQFRHQANQVRLTDGTASGSELHVKLKGGITLTSPLKASRLNFKGVILPDSSIFSKLSNTAAVKALAGKKINNRLSFTITGSLGNPKIKI